jgi:hypothetical protein
VLGLAYRKFALLTTGTRILYKIHTFVEAQQKGNIMKIFFRQGEMATLLKDCRAGVEQSLDFFQVLICLRNNN